MPSDSTVGHPGVAASLSGIDVNGEPIDQISTQCGSAFSWKASRGLGYAIPFGCRTVRADLRTLWFAVLRGYGCPLFSLHARTVRRATAVSAEIASGLISGDGELRDLVLDRGRLRRPT